MVTLHSDLHYSLYFYISSYFITSSSNFLPSWYKIVNASKASEISEIFSVSNYCVSKLSILTFYSEFADFGLLKT